MHWCSASKTSGGKCLFNKSRSCLTSWIRIRIRIRIQETTEYGSKTDPDLKQSLTECQLIMCTVLCRVGSDWSPCWSESPSPPTTRPGRCSTLPPTGGSTRSSPPPARYRVRITSLFSSRRKIMQVPVLNLTQFFLFNYCICILCITFLTNLKLFYSVLPN